MTHLNRLTRTRTALSQATVCLLLAASPAVAQSTPPDPAARSVATAQDRSPSTPTGVVAQPSTLASASKPTTAAKADTAAAPTGKWTFFGTERLRVEDWNWFPTDKANGAYTFVNSLLRAGVMRKTSRDDVMLEFAAPMLLNLPTKAVASAPQGALGLGANDYAQNHRQVATAFVKQAYIKFKNTGTSHTNLELGRFEFFDGAEVKISDKTLDWLNTNRITQRLIGNFTFTTVERSFDGIQVQAKTGERDTTLMAGYPTRGVFDLNGWDTLTRVPVAYLSSTHVQNGAKAAGVDRLFAIYYGDTRDTVKVDNRPAGVRAADTAQISLITVGGNWLRTTQVGSGRADLLLWGAGQFGKWGDLRQASDAYDAEGGWQLPRVAWKPWLRVGYYYASGAGSANSDTHATFFPILPTPRQYARFPFFSETNLKDLFASLILRPNQKLTLRMDVHDLRLADSHDLWYTGGGAFDNSVFGYTGRPSNGFSNLGTLWDISADYQVRKWLSTTLYLGYVGGGDVEESVYKSGDAVFAYAELNFKF